MSPLDRLCQWFKSPSPSQLSVMANKLSFIPDEAMRDIVERMIDDAPPGKPLPTVGQFRDAWNTWQKEHPTKVAKQRRTSCAECGAQGEPEAPGFIWARKVDPTHNSGKWREYVFRCPYCDNWRPFAHEQAIPAASRAKLESLGFQCWPWPFDQKNAGHNAPCHGGACSGPGHGGDPKQTICQTPTTCR